LVRIIAILAASAAIALGAWWALPSDIPAVPSIESLGNMDPEVSTLLHQLRAGVEKNPRDADAWGRFAMACEANGFVGTARQAYDAAARLAPREPRLAYRLALVTARLGEHDVAISELARVNELAPDYAPAWSRRGAWLLDRGDMSGASAAYERALRIDANDLQASIGLARVRLAQRDDRRAADILERTLEHHSGDRYALQLLGTAYRRLGRIDDASFALAIGASAEPAWPDPWSEAVGEYRRGFAATLKAATAEAMAGRVDRALPLLDGLRRRYPNDTSLANHSAEVLTAAGRPLEAIQLLAPILQSGSDNSDTHLALASAHLAAGDLARADAHADRAIAVDAAGSRAFEIKGAIAWRRRQLSRASTLFEQGLRRDPRHVKLLAWIGLIDLEAHRLRDAVAAFAEVIRRDPLQPDALAGLAMAHHAMGADEEAALALARAEQVAASHPRVREARARLQRVARP
jgi:tetratricopeptide (TPR) repeat protein